MTLDGSVLRGLRELDPTDPEQQRIEIVLGDEPSGRRSARSPDRLIVVPLADQRLTIVGPAKARETDQLRRQALIFLGAALLLGL